MENYLGVKRIKARLMNRLDYNIYRGWTLSEDEDGTDEGYLIEDLNEDQVNHPKHKGYISWNPKKVFKNAYQKINEMTFGFAIEAAKQGKKIARFGWNGKNMFVAYMEPLFLPPFNTQGTTRKVNDRTAKWIGKDEPLNCQPYFAMYNAQKEWIPGWVATQSDMLAEDWMIVEN